MSEVKALAERAAAAVDEAYLVDLAQRLVRTRSVFEPEQGNTEAAAAEVLVEELRAAGLEPTTQEAAPGRPNVIADWQGTAFDPSKHKNPNVRGDTPTLSPKVTRTLGLIHLLRVASRTASSMDAAAPT